MPEKYKILHISAADFSVAGIYSFSLHEELKKRNYETKIITRYAIEQTNEIISYYSPLIFFLKKIIAKIKRFIFPKPDINAKYHFHSLNEIKNYIPGEKILKKIDFIPNIIIISFTHNFINSKTVYDLKLLTGAKIFWSVPDAAPFTGGCHYSWDCENLEKKCINCPGCNSLKLQKQIHENFIFKEKYLSDIDIHWLGNSWVKKYLDKCPFSTGAKMSLVHAPVPEYDFSDDEINQYKKELDFPNNKVIFFFGAVWLDNERKGGRLLLEAINIAQKEKVFKDNAFFVFAGNRGHELLQDFDFDYKYLNKLSIEKLNCLFNIVDFVISPSTQDAGPMIINQALMAACPVIAFSEGGAVDLIKNKHNGFLLPEISAQKLSECLMEAVVASPDFSRMRVNAKETARNKVSVEKIVDIITAAFP